MTTPSIEKAARALCAAYGDEYDEQPSDPHAPSEIRKAQTRWQECATDALETLLDPSEEVVEAAARGGCFWSAEFSCKCGHPSQCCNVDDLGRNEARAALRAAVMKVLGR